MLVTDCVYNDEVNIFVAKKKTVTDMPSPKVKSKNKRMKNKKIDSNQSHTWEVNQIELDDSMENKDNPEMNEKLNRMNEEPSKWQENEVVFANSSNGYPTWPATIVKMHANKEMFLVEYFDTLNWALVTENKIFKYEENVATKLSYLWRSPYVHYLQY